MTMPRKKSRQEEETENPTAELESTMQENTIPLRLKSQHNTENLQNSLGNLKTKEGIIGYILRAPKSASIDIKDPTKIIDYAVLSSTVLDAGESLSSTFELGKMHKVTLEGKDAKMLTLRIGDNNLSIFMNKSVNPDKILKDLGIA
jgi:predicted regulator of Ras-like GTPase activity (Roadblock/LC7/MglB family)